ncbi:HalOD1 output domain-containing protein [Natronococcus sp.]|uniref:HalOD1 output domain-containing protein n=1 Tax=Natronococcus sp. TaxID=35747 RepID=UPI0025D180CF|nr:HalOD1 output domain-containing protein [Natronococcus sp.]
MSGSPPHSPRSPSLRVVDAVADAEGIDPVELEPPLYDAVDPNAIDELFTTTPSASRNGRLNFQYRGYDVTVRSDGTVSLE